MTSQDACFVLEVEVVVVVVGSVCPLPGNSDEVGGLARLTDVD